jgi:hypothetical protein
LQQVAAKLACFFFFVKQPFAERVIVVTQLVEFQRRQTPEEDQLLIGWQADDLIGKEQRPLRGLKTF